MSEEENKTLTIDVDVQEITEEGMKRVYRAIRSTLTDPHEQDMPLHVGHIDMMLHIDYGNFAAVILDDLGYITLGPDGIITMTAEQLGKEFKGSE